jgi:hypothetical protein
MRISQNSTVPSSCRVAGINGVRGIADDALGGVGGAAGRKNDGIDATEDYNEEKMVSSKSSGVSQECANSR